MRGFVKKQAKEYYRTDPEMEFLMNNQTYLERYVLSIFEQEDTNQDGIISFEEFVMSFEAVIESERKERAEEFEERMGRSQQRVEL